jgi:hypothetical protein
MNRREVLNDLFNRNPAVTALALILMFGADLYTGNAARVEVQEFAAQLEKQKYDYPFTVVSLGFEDAKDANAALTRAIFWRDNKWDAQIAALDELCDEPGRGLMLSLVDRATVVSICRIVR